MLALAACASGSVIVTGQTRDPVAPDQVKVYLEPPPAYETIGLVSAESAAGWGKQGSMDYAVEELKRQVGKLGANGVLLVGTGENTTTTMAGQGAAHPYAILVTAQTVQGKAIFIKEN
jgi:hypothetical protein